MLVPPDTLKNHWTYEVLSLSQYETPLLALSTSANQTFKYCTHNVWLRETVLHVTVTHPFNINEYIAFIKKKL